MESELQIGNILELVRTITLLWPMPSILAAKTFKRLTATGPTPPFTNWTEVKMFSQNTRVMNTNGTVDWEYLNIGTDHYLMVSNAENSGTGEQLLSVMYRWHGLDKFVPVHYLHTGPNVDIEVFTDRSNVYAIYANVN
ncbi:unnamed protein product [Lymnaea stagnalis]|uniref:Uncharacterized protein n=1 Tax=Lymnaea stagnalis TaxID=6523 RepID=A0AAV2H7N9_LYMST